MARQRVNPFAQGTAERVLFDRYRKSRAAADAAEQTVGLAAVEMRAHRSSAERYAEALRALGHGDKVPGQSALPDYSKLSE